MRAAVRPHSREVSTSSATITHVGWRPRQRRAGEDRELRAARALVLAPALVLEADVGEQAGEQRLVDVVELGGHLVDRHADALGAPRSWPARSCHSRTRR
jgi:hypothetical protein